MRRNVGGEEGEKVKNKDLEIINIDQQARGTFFKLSITKKYGELWQLFSGKLHNCAYFLRPKTKEKY